MKRTLSLFVVCASLLGCLSVEGAREGGAERTCQFHARCGSIGPGKSFSSFDQCMVLHRDGFERVWPTDRCRDRINGQTLNVCYRALENTQCNNLDDEIATVSKCESSEVCSGGAPPAGCNCGQGQTCCNNACVDLSTDLNNCGTCGTVCGGGSSCNAGACR